MKKILFLILQLFLIQSVVAKVELPNVLSDNMVLQQQDNVNLWGWAKRGAKVSIRSSWSDETIKVSADKDGRWIAQIATPKATFEPQFLEFIEDGEVVRIENILIGEVWFCSGQSNMEMPMNGYGNSPIENANEAIATSGELNGVRMVTIARSGALTAQENTEGRWMVSNPETVQWFSATAFYYARMMTKVLRVPVGIITCAWGGSRVEGWLPREIVEGYDDVDIDNEIQRIKDEKSGNEYWDMNSPLVMYYGMLRPLSNYTIKGFLWYQGEANVNSYKSYADRLSTMVGHWRGLWGDDDLPFFFVEIAPYTYGDSNIGAYLREAQFKATQIIPHSAMVSTNDLVYPRELYEIHPCQKEVVGNRLAYVALSKSYGINGISHISPSYKSIRIDGATIEVSFNNVEGGLTPWFDIEGFEIAGEDRIFHPATARLEGFTVLVTSDSVENPVAVRYCFKDFQSGNLKNHRGLPMIPFRSDSWE